MHESLSLETFSPLLHDTFWIRLPDARVETRLVEAQPLGGDRANGRTPFSLVFVGPARRVLEQQIYRLEHETLGDLDLFIVPIGPDAQGGGMRYEAIFT